MLLRIVQAEPLAVEHRLNHASSSCSLTGCFGNVLGISPLLSVVINVFTTLPTTSTLYPSRVSERGLLLYIGGTVIRNPTAAAVEDSPAA